MAGVAIGPGAGAGNFFRYPAPGILCFFKISSASQKKCFWTRCYMSERWQRYFRALARYTAAYQTAIQKPRCFVIATTAVAMTLLLGDAIDRLFARLRPAGFLRRPSPADRRRSRSHVNATGFCRWAPGTRRWEPPRLLPYCPGYRGRAAR